MAGWIVAIAGPAAGNVPAALVAASVAWDGCNRVAEGASQLIKKGVNGIWGALNHRWIEL